MIFKQLDGGHFVFQNEAKILQRHVFIAINIPYSFYGLCLQSEAMAPIIREKQGRFNVMTSFNLEAGVKGQIQHLEKIPRPWLPTSCFHIPNL